MSISSGWAKGLKIERPKGLQTRPTGARVRSAALNILAPYLEGSVFLDLFAGSGAVGLEALSRGAGEVIFVEQQPEAIKALHVNIAEAKRRAAAQGLGEPSVIVIQESVQQAKELLHNRWWEKVDVIFADPPYAEVLTWSEDLVALASRLVVVGGILMVESRMGEGADAMIAATAKSSLWSLDKQKSYGETVLSVFQRTV